MLKRINVIMLMLALLTAGFAQAAPANPAARQYDNEEKEKPMDVKEIIFEHLGDGYGWEVPFSHEHRIPLPVIVRCAPKPTSL